MSLREEAQETERRLFRDGMSIRHGGETMDLYTQSGNKTYILAVTLLTTPCVNLRRPDKSREDPYDASHCGHGCGCG
jgi:hypothetical protein